MTESNLLYNPIIKKRFETEGGIQNLSHYVMSEAMPPFEDFSSAVDLICDNISLHYGFDLTVVGAYWGIVWPEAKRGRKLLSVLNSGISSFSAEEISIAYYLNAISLRYGLNDAGASEKYKDYLLKSVEYCDNFVFNHILLSELLPDSQADRHREKARQNIIRVFSESELTQMSLEYFLEPRHYIQEHITGTHIVQEMLNEMIKK